MFERLQHEWAVIVLALFAVAAGQIGRLGQRLERGQKIGWRNVIIELSMFPAFGAMTGAVGSEMQWPIWVILGAGITAGWLGFLTFRLISRLFLGLARFVVSGGLGREVSDDLLLPPDPSRPEQSPHSPPSP